MPIPAALLVGAATIGTIASVIAGVAGSAGDKLEHDSTAGVTPESMAPPVDTRMPDKNYLVHHQTLSQPGMRLTIRGTIDGNESLTQLRGAFGHAEMNDSRSPLDEGTLDDLLTKRAR